MSAPQCRKMYRRLIRTASMTARTAYLLPAEPPGGRREAYVSTQQPPPSEEARFPRAYAHPCRALGTEEPSFQGPRPPVGLIGRLSGRQTFQRLSSTGTRVRRPALWCTWCPDDQSSRPSVGYAITRAYGNAVARNLLRRRLRTIVREHHRLQPLPPVLILIGARPMAIELTFDQIHVQMVELLTKITADYKP